MRADTLRLQQPGFDRGNHFLGNLVLQRENIAEFAIIAIGPDVIACGSIDQLRSDPYAVAVLAHAALQHIAHAQFAGHALHVNRFSLVGERRIASDDKKPVEFRQTRDDVFGNTVGEVFLLGVAAHVREWQHGNRRPRTRKFRF